MQYGARPDVRIPILMTLRIRSGQGEVEPPLDRSIASYSRARPVYGYHLALYSAGCTTDTLSEHEFRSGRLVGTIQLLVNEAVLSAYIGFLGTVL